MVIVRCPTFIYSRYPSGFRKNIFLNMMDDNPDGDRLDGNATVLPSVGAFQDILAQRVPLKMNWSESMANVV